MKLHVVAQLFDVTVAADGSELSSKRVSKLSRRYHFHKKQLRQSATPSEKKYIQEVIGTFLYYGRAVDSTMLTALSAIASAQSEPTEETMTRCKQFLDYAATHQDAILTYKASDMVLVVHSDASYLSEPKARSRAGGHFFLSSDCEDPADNGAVLNLAQLIKAVMSSAAEADLGALYINA